MTLIKWVMVFGLRFLRAFVIIVTFSQNHSSNMFLQCFLRINVAFPIYLYVAAALCLGLIIGFGVALYQFITLKTALYKKSKSIKELEEKIAILEHTSSSAPLAAVSGPPGFII